MDPGSTSLAGADGGGYALDLVTGRIGTWSSPAGTDRPAGCDEERAPRRIHGPGPERTEGPLLAHRGVEAQWIERAHLRLEAGSIPAHPTWPYAASEHVGNGPRFPGVDGGPRLGAPGTLEPAHCRWD